MPTGTPAEQARTNLEQALVNSTARLAELDAMTLADRAKMTYTVAGRTIGWNEFRASIMQEIVQTKAAVESIVALAGPYDASTTVRG